MTAPAPQPYAFHIGMVVHDLDASARRFDQLLGAMRWHTWELPLQALPTNPRTTDARLRIAYGRMPGQTIELIEVLEGTPVHRLFLEARGEGVQHLGVWVPDVAEATAAAIARGGQVMLALLRPDGTAAVQLSPGSSDADLAAAVEPGGIAYVEAGTAGIAIEFVGAARLPGLRRRFGDDFERIIGTPDWLEEARR
ncbi:MAG TPA: VOC family protein [Dehalococcoidia bacterium]|nr:VOC family protein [Dehalococcoidia bacterium]